MLSGKRIAIFEYEPENRNFSFKWGALTVRKLREC